MAAGWSYSRKRRIVHLAANAADPSRHAHGKVSVKKIGPAKVLRDITSGNNDTDGRCLASTRIRPASRCARRSRRSSSDRRDAAGNGRRARPGPPNWCRPCAPYAAAVPPSEPPRARRSCRRNSPPRSRARPGEFANARRRRRPARRPWRRDLSGRAHPRILTSQRAILPISQCRTSPGVTWLTPEQVPLMMMSPGHNV